MVSIKDVATKAELVRFMDFPLKLYKGCPYYIPDVLSSQVADLMKDKNPAFGYCEAKAFLAYRDGEIVGRICGILNRKANEKFKRNYLNFTHVDFIDDDEVVDALFAAVEAYARSLGCEAVHGPLGFSDMDREGMLVEGFDRESLFYTYYNYPYYVTQMNRLGYQKQVDWVEYRLLLPAEPDPQITRLSDYMKKKMNLHVVNLGDKPINEIMHGMFTLFNKAYTALFGVVPMNEAQMEKYTNEFRPMVNKKTTTFIYNEQDEMVAFGIACPSLDHAMRKSRGRMFPLGWVRLLKALKGKNEQLDMLLIAVDPTLQGNGINSIVLDDIQKKVIKAGYKYAETGPMLEENVHILAQWQRYEGEQHKRRRCFCKEL